MASSFWYPTQQADEPYIRQDGLVSAASGIEFDAPASFYGLKITAQNGVRLVTDCPVFMPSWGKSMSMCRLYANEYGTLPGGVLLPLSAVQSWEWQKRVCVSDDFLRPARHGDSDDWADVRLEYLRKIAKRTTRFGARMSVDCRANHGNPWTRHGFAVWYHRTAGERGYCDRLADILRRNPAFSEGPGGEKELLCLGLRVPRTFRFDSHTRGGGGKSDAHSQHNNHVRWAHQVMLERDILLDYHNLEVENVTDAGLKELFVSMPTFWRENFMCGWGNFFASMPPCLTFLTDVLMQCTPFTGVAWKVLSTERIALIAVEWHRQVYSHLHFVRLSPWMFNQIGSIADNLDVCLGNKRNVRDLKALLCRARQICPIWFDGVNSIPTPTKFLDEAPWVWQRRQVTVGFNVWTNSRLNGGENERKRLQRNRPLFYEGMPAAQDWESTKSDVCYLSVLDGDNLPWTSQRSQNAPSMAFAASYLQPEESFGVTADTGRNNAVDGMGGSDVAVGHIEGPVMMPEERPVEIVGDNSKSFDPIPRTSNQLLESDQASCKPSVGVPTTIIVTAPPVNSCTEPSEVAVGSTLSAPSPPVMASSKKVLLSQPAPSERGEGASAKASADSVKPGAPRKGSAGKAAASRDRDDSARNLAKDVHEDIDEGYGQRPIIVDEEDSDSEEDIRPLPRKAKRAVLVGGRRDSKVANRKRKFSVSPVARNAGRRVRRESGRREGREISPQVSRHVSRRVRRRLEEDVAEVSDGDDTTNDERQGRVRGSLSGRRRVGARVSSAAPSSAVRFNYSDDTSYAVVFRSDGLEVVPVDKGGRAGAVFARGVSDEPSIVIEVSPRTRSGEREHFVIDDLVDFDSDYPLGR